MANYDLIFDLGSQNISAALKKDGFTDKIPSVVAVSGDARQIVAVGVEALRMASNGGVKLIHPILEGAIVDVEGVKALVSSLLTRLINYKINAFSRYNAICIVPCGIISSDKNAIESLFLSFGVKQVTFTETPLADSYQLFAEFRARHGIIVDIGYDCTDLAIVAENTIVAGCTLYYSGKQLTEAIRDRIKAKYMIQLSYDAAEFLKVNCAGLYLKDTTVVTVSGQNIQRGVTEQVNVSSKELYDTVADFVRKYVQVINGLLNSVTRDIAASAREGGVMLCGGGARLAGLDAFLQDELKMPVNVAAYPEDVSIKGMLL